MGSVGEGNTFLFLSHRALPFRQPASACPVFLAPFHIVCSFLSKQHFDNKAAGISAYMSQLMHLSVREIH